MRQATGQPQQSLAREETAGENPGASTEGRPRSVAIRPEEVRGRCGAGNSWPSDADHDLSKVDRHWVTALTGSGEQPQASETHGTR